MTNRKKVIGITVAAVMVLGAIVLGVYLWKVKQYQSQVGGMSYRTEDISQIADGVYTGECDVDFIYAKVEVEVENGEMTGVKLLEHRHDRGEKAESITGEILEQQKIDVEEVAGATNSSKVIKKAVENALWGT